MKGIEIVSCCLYQLVFPNGKKYFGITNDFANRMAQHERAARKGKENPVYRAIRKYGWCCVEKSVMAIGALSYIKELEQKAIAHFGSLVPDGYNVTPGGDSSPMLVEEVRRKVSASMIERFKDPAVRAANSEAQKIAQNRPEVRAIRSAIVRGRKHTEEAKKKISEGHKGKRLSKEAVEKSANSRRGARRSDESRARMSEGQKRRVRTAEELARMSEIAKKRVMTPEYKAKLSAAAKARWAKQKEKAA